LRSCALFHTQHSSGLPRPAVSQGSSQGSHVKESQTGIMGSGQGGCRSWQGIQRPSRVAGSIVLATRWSRGALPIDRHCRADDASEPDWRRREPRLPSASNWSMINDRERGGGA
jgi:hypothetical protein